MNLDITALNPEDIPRARDVFAAVFGHRISAAHWDWKYAQGPRLGSINLVARTARGELVGHIGCIVFQGASQGQPLAFAQVCDVMVSRHVRGGLDQQGVYPQLVKALQKSLLDRFEPVFAYGFPGERPFRLGERMGFYRRLYPVPSFRFDPASAEKPGFQLQTLVAGDWDGMRLDAICKRLAHCQAAPAVSRTGAYLLWRYAAHPERCYKLWFVRKFWKDIGWLVTARAPNDDEVIVDALLPPHVSVDAACNLLWQKLRAVQPPAKALVHWLAPCSQAMQSSGIVATEFLTGQWHTHLQNPRFQPGDTDVF
ncbi:MAG: GNAT family N-acetyltransferase [Polaromonas sp.]